MYLVAVAKANIRAQARNKTMSDQIHVGSVVIATKDIRTHDIVKGEKLIVSCIRTDLIQVHGKYSSLQCYIPIESVVLESDFDGINNDKLNAANNAVLYARASAQGALNEFLPVLEAAKQFIEGKTHSNACHLHKKFVDLLSSMHFLECELEYLSTLKE